jgi:hypothetical protein
MGSIGENTGAGVWVPEFWVMDSGNPDHLRRPCHATCGGGKVVAVHDRERAVLGTRWPSLGLGVKAALVVPPRRFVFVVPPRHFAA